ncbi:TetR/AcrR family transcriptional regulator [Zhongshania marina]|uniref:TetR/AcrR family transcriptional regulator n=1 Tax=Zhongshania marina TaxID=2304603 RepID=A0ABX9W4A6_9GAMM|nr:TetR/AcrR family transcriptional regulator [Zhongshania marina]
MKPLIQKGRLAVTEGEIEPHLRRVLDTARDMLARLGSADKITIRDLASASQVSPATLYNRFGDKDSLLTFATLEHFEQNAGLAFVSPQGGSPLERIESGLRLIEQECKLNPALVRSLTELYFRPGTNQHLRPLLYHAIFDSVKKPLDAMRQDNLFQSWISVDALCVEICDRTFSIIHRWVQNDIPISAIGDHLTFGADSLLLGALRQEHQITIEKRIRNILKSENFATRLPPENE